MVDFEEIVNSEEEEASLAVSEDDAVDEDDLLAQFLESEVLAEDSEGYSEDLDQEELTLRPSKRLCVEGEVKDGPVIAFAEKDFDCLDDGSWPCSESGVIAKFRPTLQSPGDISAENRLCTETDVDTKLRPALQTPGKNSGSSRGFKIQSYIESGVFSKIPAELFQKILKFLSSEDLVKCALVCRFLNFAASDESLWRRLYCMRWGLSSPAELQGKLRSCAWKQLYIERDEEDMIEFARNTPAEFREYYIQMQAAKRSQAPLPSQVKDDMIVLDTTVADQITHWKHSRGLPDEFTADHACSGRMCTYSQIGDAFICEKTGRVHVCDDTCREIVLDPSNELLVCTISGRCFDRWLSPSEEELNPGEEQGDANTTVDEAEPFMGSGRFARAYLLGYNCDDEKELEAALACC